MDAAHPPIELDVNTSKFAAHVVPVTPPQEHGEQARVSSMPP